MKKLLTLGLILYVGVAWAQPQVLTTDEAQKTGLLEKIKEKYPHAQVPEGLTPNLISDKLKAFLPTNPKPGFSIFLQVLISAEGKPDYVFFNVNSPAAMKDSVTKMILDSLPGRLATWRINNPAKQAFQAMEGFGIGKVPEPRQLRTGDSTLVTLNDARTYQDTLRVKRLLLNQLELSQVPYELVYRFPNLEELDLHGNELTDLRLDLARLPRLRQLDLRGNQLGKGTLALTKNSSLRILNVQANGLVDVPQAARACKGLTSLWLGRNALTGLSSRSFRKLKKLEDLNLYQTKLSTLPPGVRKLRRLEVLDLYYNEFTELPAAVTRLRRLTHLAVANNQLTELPPRIDRLQRLHTIYVHHNRLSTLPSRLAGLNQLTLLDIGYNWFTNFPPEITALRGLKELDLSGNNFQEFPQPLLRITQLEKLYLRGNPFLKENAEQQYGVLFNQIKAHATEVFY
ncbi:hypothetical protein GCM10027275_20840 [Rhabdobacter roseus]|uniref:Leucine-rich repeat (LRR) protein n=1 Tax=Rhabdobacter roseus TaxID=1655419 RepID=A0A840TQM4_9BACT|nr:leucine-rich repeat domain-containing protein [Rhabdobacter roseus]MBB5284017.1 Leucine-rich repeat (LRR) protein [Rhabdobacter roseus]